MKELTRFRIFNAIMWAVLTTLGAIAMYLAFGPWIAIGLYAVAALASLLEWLVATRTFNEEMQQLNLELSARLKKEDAEQAELRG